MISKRKSEQVSKEMSSHKAVFNPLTIPDCTESSGYTTCRVVLGTERESAPDCSAMQLQKGEKAVANPQLKATVSYAEKLQRQHGLIRAVSLREKQLRNSTPRKSERSTAKKVCIACGIPNLDKCNCFANPGKKREIDGRLEELFAAQKRKMSVPEYRQYQHHKKCYMQKHKVPYSEMIMGHGYDDLSWADVSRSYYINTVRIQDALGIMGMDISLPYFGPKDSQNHMLGTMFANHQTIAKVLTEMLNDRDERSIVEHAYDDCSWEDVSKFYIENTVRIENALKTMGMDISLSYFWPKDSEKDMIKTSFNNHERIAEVLPKFLARSNRDKRSPGAIFGGVFLLQTIAGYFIGKGIDHIWESFQNLVKDTTKPTLSDYTRILAQPELFGILQEWLYSCEKTAPDTPLEDIPMPTNMSICFQDGRQVITIPGFVSERTTLDIFYHFLNKLATPYYEVEQVNDTETKQRFAALLFHNGKVSFRDKEGSNKGYAKFMTDHYLNFSWTQ